MLRRLMAIMAMMMVVATAGANPSALWDAFVAARANGERPPLVDFSHAGYRGGAVEPPRVEGPVFNVLDYGAVPDDGVSDRDAIQAAITAAETAGGGVVFFPPGRFHLNTAARPGSTIRIRRSGVVLRGSGYWTGGTELFMEANFRPTDPTRFWTTPFMIEISPTNQGTPFIANITEASRRDSRSIVVDNAAAITPGQWVTVSLRDPNAIEDFLAPYTPPAAWTRLFTDGIRASERHRVERVEGNRIYLQEPLLVDVDPQYNWRLLGYNVISEIGVEDIAFRGNWRENFVHHLNATHDYGWSALLFIHCVDSWVRRCRFIDWNYSVQFDRTSYSSVLHSTIEGNGGHFGYVSRISTNTLFGLSQDIASSFHGPSWGYESCGVVFWRFDYNGDSSFDGHSGTPYATLLDRTTGGIRYGRAGGPIEGLPNHLRDLVLWNFRQIGEPTQNFDFWRADPFAYDRYIEPLIVGFEGNGASFVEERLGTLESFGNAVTPASLYEAQMAMRLGAVPAWIERAKRDWDIIRRRERLVPVYTAVAIQPREPAGSALPGYTATLDVQLAFTGLADTATDLVMAEVGGTSRTLELSGVEANFPITLAEGPDGPRHVVFTLSNITAALAPTTATVVLDRVPPPAPAPRLDGDPRRADRRVVIRWEPVEEPAGGSGVHRYQVRAAMAGAPLTIVSTAATEVELPLEDGAHAIAVRSVDRAGNTSDWAALGDTIIVDTTPPAAPQLLTILPSRNVEDVVYTNAAGVALAGTAPGAVTVRVTAGGDAVDAAVDDTDNWSAEVALPAVDGPTLLSAIALDDLGNASEPTTRTLVVDRTAPVLAVEALTPLLTGGAIVEFTVTRDGQPIPGLAALLATTTTGDATATLAVEGARVRLTGPTGNGTIALGVAAAALADAAGNAPAVDLVLPTVTVDTTPPAIAITSTAPFGAGSVIPVVYTGSDPHWRHALLLVAEPGLAPVEHGPANTSESGRFDFAPTQSSFFAAGDYAFQLRAMDRAGNVADSAVYTIAFNPVLYGAFGREVDPGAAPMWFPMAPGLALRLVPGTVRQRGSVVVDYIPVPAVMPGSLRAERLVPGAWDIQMGTTRTVGGRIELVGVAAGAVPVERAYRLAPGEAFAVASYPASLLPDGTIVITAEPAGGTWMVGAADALTIREGFVAY